MRLLALAILALGMATVGDAQAQTYDPRFPICMHLVPYGGGAYEDCRYYTMEQCQMAASGRAGTCNINPFYAGGPPSVRAGRRYRDDY
jgi:hypothetical protein